MQSNFTSVCRVEENGDAKDLDTPFVNNYHELTFSEFCFFINPFVVDIAVSRGE